MDLQEMLNNKIKADRSDQFKGSEQLSLGEMILKMEAIVKELGDKAKTESVFLNIEDSFPVGLHSWRGSYCELAIEYANSKTDSDDPMSAVSFHELLKGAVGETYTGYKGGDFTMGRSTPVWVSHYGIGGHLAVVDIIYKKRIIVVTKEIEY